MAAAVTLHPEEYEYEYEYELDDDASEAPEVQWFERNERNQGALTPIPPRGILPDGTLGDRAWRARGWSTED